MVLRFWSSVIRMECDEDLVLAQGSAWVQIVGMAYAGVYRQYEDSQLIASFLKKN
jgi:hypothetical protein